MNQCAKELIRGCDMRIGLLTLDANVLIDLSKTDRTVLNLISKHIGQVYVPITIFEEVKQIDETECLGLGIILHEPELDHLFAAAVARGKLSFQDHLCLILAKENRWICVTNDMALRNECAKEDVRCIWGIELICLLVEAGGLPPDHAKELIKSIQSLNSKFITESIVERAFIRIRTWVETH